MVISSVQFKCFRLFVSLFSVSPRRLFLYLSYHFTITHHLHRSMPVPALDLDFKCRPNKRISNESDKRKFSSQQKGTKNVLFRMDIDREKKRRKFFRSIKLYSNSQSQKLHHHINKPKMRDRDTKTKATNIEEKYRNRWRKQQICTIVVCVGLCVL